MNVYPIKGPTITLKEAIEFIVGTIYPDDEIREAQKRVRARIKYHQKIGGLSEGEKFHAGDLFLYITKKIPDWSSIKDVSGLPMSFKEQASASAKANVQCSHGYLNIIPNDPLECREALKKAQRTIQDHEVKIHQLESEVQGLTVEIDEYRAKDEKKRKDGSRAGKMGGRGNIK